MYEGNGKNMVLDYEIIVDRVAFMKFLLKKGKWRQVSRKLITSSSLLYVNK